MTFRLATPWALLLLLPLAFAAWRMLRRSRVASAIPFAPMSRLPIRTAGWRGALVRAVPWLFIGGAALLIIAAARPQGSFSRERKSTDAIAIAMVVDVSGSMEALDLTRGNPADANAQNRLDVVKECFGEFIEKRPDDLIALIAFGGYATTRSPLTADHEALLQILKATTIPGMEYDEQGRPVSQEELLTAVGDGLTTACARLKDAEPKTRIIVLLSDGVSNTGVFTPDFAADVAKGLGIKVYTIGVGSNSGNAPFRVRDAFGRTRVVYGQTEFNDAELRAIATKTGGKYFNVRDNAGFKVAMADIDKLETTKVTRMVYTHYQERYLPFLVLGAFAVALAILANILVIHRPL